MHPWKSRWLIVVAKYWPNAGKAGRWRRQRMTPSLLRTRQCRSARSDILRRWRQLAAVARGLPTYRCPSHRHGWLRRRLSVACKPPDALPPPGVLYKRHPSSPETRGLTPASTHTHMSKFGRFLTSKEGVNLYANSLVRKYILYVNFHVK